MAFTERSLFIISDAGDFVIPRILATSILPNGLSNENSFLSLIILLVERTEMPEPVKRSKSCLTSVESCLAAPKSCLIAPLKEFVEILI